ncbi:pre-B-cell leukemia transcription factor 3D [Capsaspora owczarzaki ATCC 30864]|uniref:pre-B-cell leukemia transcription factor 3D n=1 Tax=Capsaspora owczarzaki (strain ATCC 30864) TaxID=595528 RepID=UPI0001FE3C3A|nr:pre-B-cell leukemia transcription factor 3D [Capsaspora owczarzaki ATCC 30864]|eukprot:XP_004346127.1 pre-B-cell leukemia transcription factor 3D [Capsaspora owczarzaki ATCC 30864]
MELDILQELSELEADQLVLGLSFFESKADNEQDSVDIGQAALAIGDAVPAWAASGYSDFWDELSLALQTPTNRVGFASHDVTAAQLDVCLAQERAACAASETPSLAEIRGLFAFLDMQLLKVAHRLSSLEYQLKRKVYTKVIFLKSTFLDSRKRRINLSREAQQVLNDWFLAHIEHPYPSESEKEQLADQTNLTMRQISTWFANKRNRQAQD